MKRFVTVLAVGLGIVVGCSSDDDKHKIGNGVNSVTAACEIRRTWNRSISNCFLCEAGVASERCECEALKDFSAACLEQEKARKAACDEQVQVCYFGCKQEDCACVEACYANVPPACRQAADARDGCVAEACTQFCK